MKKVIKKETPVTEVSLTTVSQQNQAVNFDPANQVEFAQKAAKALMVVIDATKPLVMQGKRYLYFEHWQTIARFFNTTVGIESTTKDENGYIAKAIVYNKDGVVIGGAEASCMNDERNWKGKPDFQLRSMAQTRAMAKALRSMYGFVAVLAGIEATPAEEMNSVEHPTTYGRNSDPYDAYEAPKKTYTKYPAKPAEALNAYNSLADQITKATTVESLNLIANDVKIAFSNKKINQGQLEMLVEIGKSMREKLDPQAKEIKQIADSLPFN